MSRRHVGWEKIPPRELVGDFEGGEYADPATGRIINIRRIEKVYPGEISSTTALGIIGALVVAIGVYAYMKGNPLQPPIG